MDFATLITKCSKRDNKAREQVYALFSAQMYSICVRYVGNKLDADDIFQQGFLQVFEDIGQVRNPDALPGWIKMVFINTALRHLKKQKSVLVICREDLSNDYDHIDNNALVELEVEKIVELINLLPSRCREVFNLFVIDGYKHQEIAELLKISVGSSKSYLHEAKQRLMSEVTLLNKTYLINIV